MRTATAMHGMLSCLAPRRPRAEGRGRRCAPPLAWAMAWVMACVLLASATASAQFRYTDGIRQRDAELLQRQIAALAPQRAGTVDLYTLGFAGDSSENVFRNEVHYFEDLMRQRFGADGRTLALVNHADSLFVRPRPLATLENLRTALAGIGDAMDPDEDMLLLFMTMHGSRDHRLQVQMAPAISEWVSPEDIREALDDAGIRNRVVVISACFSGGFIPALRDEHTAVLTAARANRPSFGCGTESVATYFGRAWMIEGLNATTDPLAAFDSARTRIRERERAEGFDPSLPQLHIGNGIRRTLAAWQAQLQPGPPLAYPYVEEAPDVQTADKDGRGLIRHNGPRPTDKGRGRASGPAPADDAALDSPQDDAESRVEDALDDPHADGAAQDGPSTPRH